MKVLYTKRNDRKTFLQEGLILFYRPDGKAVCADVIPFYEDGEFKLFYLKDYRDIEHYGEGCDWNLLTTRDFVTYTDHGTVIKRGTKDEQDLYVYTGCCNRYGDTYFIYYTGHNPHMAEKGLPVQKILRARSKDLLHWEKDTQFSMQAPAGFEMHDFRDPFIYYDEKGSRYCMLIAGRLKNADPENFKGVTLVAYSDDFLHWEVDEKPFYAPSSYYAHECPDLFRMGDWWYLVFSEFTDRYITTYRMSQNPDGPWLTPPVNTFDGHAFYAAKSVSDGKRRFLLGWNPIKEGEKDFGSWQWGGTIIAHEIVQNADGTLAVRCPEEVLRSYGPQTCPQPGSLVGAVQMHGERCMVGDRCGRGHVMFGRLPDRCKIEVEFTLQEMTGDFGLVLHADLVKNTFYTLRMEPAYCRMAMDRWPRRELACHTMTDTERPVSFLPGERNRLTLLIDGSVLEAYFNDRAAMGARMFDLRGDWGVYAVGTAVSFEKIAISEEGQ